MGKNILIIIDAQNDFAYGPLGTKEAREAIPRMKKVLDRYLQSGSHVIFTRDTHTKEYEFSQEHQFLPVEHCMIGSDGWQIVDELSVETSENIDIVNKLHFGYDYWDLYCLDDCNTITIMGFCTDICVITNALLLKTHFPEVQIYVLADCCAGTTPEMHEKALDVMRSCQINIV